MGETVTSKVIVAAHGGAEIGGFLARPESAGPHPALVLVHEIFGLTDYMQQTAERFAEEGFVTVVPDLWWRDTPDTPGEPLVETDLLKLREFVETIPDAQMIGDLVAAARWLRERPEVRKDGIGTAGFYMGGIYAFHLACEEGTPVKACVDFYGRITYPNPSDIKPRSNLQKVGELKCPLLGIFGGIDPFIPLQDVLHLKERVGGRGSIIAYPRAGHGFMAPDRGAYREDDADDAWRRTMIFLKEKLAPDLLEADAGPAVPEFVPKKQDKNWKNPHKNKRRGKGKGRGRGRKR